MIGNEEGSQLFTEIRQKLFDNMHNRNDDRKRFICESQLRSVWVSASTIQDALKTQNFSIEQCEDIYKRFLKILSILVYVKAVDDFPPLYQHCCSILPKANDQDLPFDTHKLDILPFSNSYRRARFGEQQYIFCPYIVKERPTQTTESLSELYRLPFVGSKLLGGDVVRTEVPTDCLEHSNSLVEYKKVSRSP